MWTALARVEITTSLFISMSFQLANVLLCVKHLTQGVSTKWPDLFLFTDHLRIQTSRLQIDLYRCHTMTHMYALIKHTRADF